MAHDHTFHYAAGIAFRTVLAVFPMMIAGLLLLSLLGAGERAGDVIGSLGSSQIVPGRSAEALQSQLDELESPGPGRILGGLAALALALWSGASAFRTIMTALNEALDVDEHRKLIKRFLVSLGLSLLTAVIVLAATLLVAIGPEIGDLIADAPGGSGGWFVAWRLVRWPLVAALVLAWLSTTYAWAPAVPRRPWAVTHGKVVAFVGWLLFAVGYSWYVDSIGKQDKVYGSFAGIVAFQLYVYGSALIVLLGAEVDCVTNDRREKAEDDRLASNR
jgi:membrane protein